MDVTVEIHCEACGSANYSLAAESDDSRIRCNDCGADQGSFGELKLALGQAALSHSAEALRSGLGWLDGAEEERG